MPSPAGQLAGGERRQQLGPERRLDLAPLSLGLDADVLEQLQRVGPALARRAAARRRPPERRSPRPPPAPRPGGDRWRPAERRAPPRAARARSGCAARSRRSRAPSRPRARAARTSPRRPAAGSPRASAAAAPSRRRRSGASAATRTVTICEPEVGERGLGGQPAGDHLTDRRHPRGEDLPELRGRELVDHVLLGHLDEQPLHLLERRLGPVAARQVEREVDPRGDLLRIGEAERDHTLHDQLLEVPAARVEQERQLLIPERDLRDRGPVGGKPERQARARAASRPPR